tara:strand:+ start:2293 stop:2616 length:324 start_codon:yes stop_codon:yes gene_type:complete
MKKSRLVKEGDIVCRKLNYDNGIFLFYKVGKEEEQKSRFDNTMYYIIQENANSVIAFEYSIKSMQIVRKLWVKYESEDRDNLPYKIGYMKAINDFYTELEHLYSKEI